MSVDPSSEHYRSLISQMTWCTWRVIIQPKTGYRLTGAGFNVIGTRRRAERITRRQLARDERQR